MERSIKEQIDSFIEHIKNSINCQCPAVVEKVNADGTVDLKVYRNDDIPGPQYMPSVEVKHLETNRAFIHLGLEKGDCGVIRYFDRSTSNYIEGIDNFDGDIRCHNANDSCFELGFLPNQLKYVYPAGEIVIGSKNGQALIKIDKDNINITGGNINITGGNIIINGNTTIDGKVFLQHQHTDSQGGTTTGVI